jgi:hypothetical protein
LLLLLSYASIYIRTETLTCTSYIVQMTSLEVEPRNICRFFLATDALTPRSRVPLEKLIVAQLVNEFPAFHGTRILITVFTTPRHKPDESNPHPHILFFRGKGKDKVVPVLVTQHHTMKAYWGS